MLLLPVAALVLKASTEKPMDFWKIATSPTLLLPMMSPCHIVHCSLDWSLRAFNCLGLSPVRFPTEAVH